MGGDTDRCGRCLWQRVSGRRRWERGGARARHWARGCGWGGWANPGHSPCCQGQRPAQRARGGSRTGCGRGGGWWGRAGGARRHPTRLAATLSSHVQRGGWGCPRRAWGGVPPLPVCKNGTDWPGEARRVRKRRVWVSEQWRVEGPHGVVGGGGAREKKPARTKNSRKWGTNNMVPAGPARVGGWSGVQQVLDGARARVGGKGARRGERCATGEGPAERNRGWAAGGGCPLVACRVPHARHRWGADDGTTHSCAAGARPRTRPRPHHQPLQYPQGLPLSIVQSRLAATWFSSLGMRSGCVKQGTVLSPSANAPRYHGCLFQCAVRIVEAESQS